VCLQQTRNYAFHRASNYRWIIIHFGGKGDGFFFVFWPFWQCQAQLNSLTQNWGMHIAVIFIYFGNALCLSHNNMYMYSTQDNATQLQVIEPTALLLLHCVVVAVSANTCKSIKRRAAGLMYPKKKTSKSMSNVYRTIPSVFSATDADTDTDTDTDWNLMRACLAFHFVLVFYYYFAQVACC